MAAPSHGVPRVLRRARHPAKRRCVLYLPARRLSVAGTPCSGDSREAVGQEGHGLQHVGLPRGPRAPALAAS